MDGEKSSGCPRISRRGCRADPPGGEAHLAVPFDGVSPGVIDGFAGGSQLPQQQQEQTLDAVGIAGIGGIWDGWGLQLSAHTLLEKSDQLVAAQLRPATKPLLPANVLQLPSSEGVEIRARW